MRHWCSVRSGKARNVGAFGDLVTFSFHPNKNITSIEGGALVVNDAAEAARVEAAALPRHHATCPTHARRRATRRQVQHAGRQRAHRLRAARALPDFLAARRRSSIAISSASPRDPACVLPPRPAGGGRRPVVEHVLRAAAARRSCSIDASSSATRSTRAASAPASPTRRCTCARWGGASAAAKASSRNAERIARETVTLPLHTAMTHRPTSIAYATRSRPSSRPLGR